MSVLDRLTPRERALTLGGGLVLLCLAGWQYGWRPVEDARQAVRGDIQRYMTLIRVADRAADMPMTAAASRPATPLAQRVTQSAEAAGILLTRLDPEGPALRITVAEVAFAQAVEWIATLESDSGINARSVDIARLTGPGDVSLRAVVEDAP